MICIDLKAELKAVLRKYFMRVGPAFGVCQPIPQCLSPQGGHSVASSNSGNPSLSSVGSNSLPPGVN